MFTIKSTDAHGHTVHECASYRFRRGLVMAPNGVNGDQRPFEGHHEKDASFIDMFDPAGDLIQSFIIDGTTYCMNAAGKTIDTFHAAPKTDRLGHPLGVG